MRRGDPLRGPRSRIERKRLWIPGVSAFTRVHSPYLKGVYARLRGLWTGVNALNDALCAGMSGKEAMTFRSSPRRAPGDARVGDPELRIVPTIAIDRFVIAITSSEARCWHAAHVQSAGAFRQSKGRDGTSACFRRKQREMRHVEKQLGYHHAGVVVWIRRGHARPIFTGSSARRRASSRRMRRTPYRIRMRLSQLQGMASPRPP